MTFMDKHNYDPVDAQIRRKYVFERRKIEIKSYRSLGILTIKRNARGVFLSGKSADST